MEALALKLGAGNQASRLAVSRKQARASGQFAAAMAFESGRSCGVVIRDITSSCTRFNAWTTHLAPPVQAKLLEVEGFS